MLDNAERLKALEKTRIGNRIIGWALVLIVVFAFGFLGEKSKELRDRVGELERRVEQLENGGSEQRKAKLPAQALAPNNRSTL